MSVLYTVQARLTSQYANICVLMIMHSLKNFRSSQSYPAQILIAMTFKTCFLFQFQAAAKVLAEAEKLTGKSAESSDVDEPQQTVFIDAPPPKVNVWLKKSDNSAQAV